MTGTTAHVVADTDRLDATVLAELGAVCARAAAELLPWRALPASRPILIVGALGRGERQIPAPLLEAVNARGASLLLLSDDSLIRTVVTTHGGRVTLISPLVSRARLRGTIRMLLARRGGFAREQLHQQVWTAMFGATGGQAPAQGCVAAPGSTIRRSPGAAIASTAASAFAASNPAQHRAAGCRDVELSRRPLLLTAPGLRAAHDAALPARPDVPSDSGLGRWPQGL